LSSQILADVANFPTLSRVKVLRNERRPVSNERRPDLFLGLALGLDEFPKDWSHKTFLALADLN
jgi:hypothetical protein